MDITLQINPNACPLGDGKFRLIYYSSNPKNTEKHKFFDLNLGDACKAPTLKGLIAEEKKELNIGCITDDGTTFRQLINYIQLQNVDNHEVGIEALLANTVSITVLRMEIRRLFNEDHVKKIERIYGSIEQKRRAKLEKDNEEKGKQLIRQCPCPDQCSYKGRRDKCEGECQQCINFRFCEFNTKGTLCDGKCRQCISRFCELGSLCRGDCSRCASPGNCPAKFPIGQCDGSCKNIKPAIVIPMQSTKIESKQEEFKSPVESNEEMNKNRFDKIYSFLRHSYQFCYKNPIVPAIGLFSVGALYLL